MEEIWENVKWQNVDSISCGQSGEAGFWKAVNIWIQKPHVVNRRLSGATIIHRVNLSAKTLSLFLRESRKILANGHSTADDILNGDSGPQGGKTWMHRSDVKVNTEEHLENEGGHHEAVGGCHRDDLLVEVIIRKLLPKQLERNVPVNECVIQDKKMKCATFISFQQCGSNAETQTDDTIAMYAYRVTLIESAETRICLQTLADCHPVDQMNGVTRPTLSWLVKNLLPKLVKWCMDTEPSSSINSNSLISMENYNILYQQLKQKYGPEIIRAWPENTDPQKFVYEDIAIATYLLMLWEQERRDQNLDAKQSFVDLGCGNGLLVHLLNSEGHPGKGIDVRRRKIWNIYGQATNLEERTIIPSDRALFPDCDWLIGNHSDELTPWIPVIAARSSYNTRYFVLPCCFHDFNCKFRRTRADIAQYRTYLNYISEIGEICGFTIEEDALRIPSTKRICQIGKQRTYPIDEQSAIESQMQDFIAEKCRLSVTRKDTEQSDQSPCNDTVNCASNCGQATDCDNTDPTEGMQHWRDYVEMSDDAPRHPIGGGVTADGWIDNFKPRGPRELVRNCSTVDRALRVHITNTIAGKLLELGTAEDMLNVELEEGTQKRWNRGGKLPLPEVAAMFTSKTLGQLKNECGGLQTLLRNSHQVFQVFGGVVQLRDWSKMEPIRKHKAKWQREKRDQTMTSNSSKQLQKTKLCWFYMNHPDGCPRRDDLCTFAHGSHELRQRPNFNE